MNKEADITFEKNRFYVSGDLNFYNVMSVYEKSLPQMKPIADLNVDFSQLNSSDSSALALIMEWVRFAKLHQKRIQFSNISTQLTAIAKVSGLNEIISNVR